MLVDTKLLVYEEKQGKYMKILNPYFHTHTNNTDTIQWSYSGQYTSFSWFVLEVKYDFENQFHVFYYKRLKVKQSLNRPGVVQKVTGGLRSQISWHSAREGVEVVSLTHRSLLPPGMFLVLIFTRGWVDPRAIVESEGNMSLKDPDETSRNRSQDCPTSSVAP